MIEHCPARSLEPDEFSGLIVEPNIPEACIACIQRALDDPAISKEKTDTYDQGLAAAREFVGDEEAPEDRFDRWKVITLYPPQNGLARRALDEYGFDLGYSYGTSYEDGTETQVVDVTFDCYQETETRQA